MRSGFYGSGESFLFQNVLNGVKVFEATLENTFFIYSAEDGFGMGSEDHFGLFVQNDLTNGTTRTCKTYSND